tara:strand:+ start:1059 stop:1640 length:582 start_codon:yes stop_codon:yes gene_type:complete
MNASAHIPEIRSLGNLFERASLGLEFTAKTAQTCGKIIEDMNNLSGAQRLAKMIEIFGILCETEEFQSLSTQDFVSKFKPNNTVNHQQLDKALAFIQENYAENLSLNQVAKIVSMSESAFSRFFKSQTGNSYTDHILKLRIWTAKKLLKDNDTPVTDICYEAGFSNISNFNRTFLKQTGMKPSEYRKATKQLK